MIITDTNDKKNYHKIFEDGTDIRAFTVYNFVDSIVNRSPANVDILKSSMFQLDKGHKLYPYLSNLRFDKYVYIDGMESEAFTHIRASLMRKDGEDDKRANKALKTSLRNLALSNRIYEQDQDYSPEFSDMQREEFYKGLSYSVKEANRIRHLAAPYFEKAVERSTLFRGNRDLLKADGEYIEANEQCKAYVYEVMDYLNTFAVKIK